MKKTVGALSLFLTLILLCLSGCMPLDALKLPAPKEVNYANKALIRYCDEEQPQTVNIVDQLFALNAPNPENHTPLVSGAFEKFACVDGTLAVYMELTYYVFDIENYEYPPASIIGSYDAWRAYMEPFYHRYTIPEFEEACPQFQDCDWTVIREKTPRR